MLFRYNIIYTTDTKQSDLTCNQTIRLNKNENSVFLSSDNKKVVIKEKRHILLLYSDETGTISSLNTMITEKIDCDVYLLKDLNTSQLRNYDFILLGTSVVNEEPTDEIKKFLTNTDFGNIDLSFYWVGAFNNDEFEKKLTSYVKRANMKSGLGLNSDEISEKEKVSYIVDQWLTSTYVNIPKCKKT